MQAHRRAPSNKWRDRDGERTPTSARRFMTWWRSCGARHLVRPATRRITSSTARRRLQLLRWFFSCLTPHRRPPYQLHSEAILRRNSLSQADSLSATNWRRFAMHLPFETRRRSNEKAPRFSVHSLQRSTPMIHLKCTSAKPFLLRKHLLVLSRAESFVIFIKFHYAHSARK